MSSKRIKKHNSSYNKSLNPIYLEKYNKGKADFLKNPKDIHKIAKHHKLSIEDFKKNLRKDGIHVPNQNIDYEFNENIFETINTEEKAYWLGFLYADGYVSNRGVELCIKDLEHMEKFKKFLNCSNKIQTKIVKGNEYYRISKRNSKLRDDLIRHGCVNNKSLILEFPNEDTLLQEYHSHFIRGYFDGDGCVSISNDKKFLISILGTYNFLEKVKHILKFPENKYAMSGKAYEIRTACFEEVYRILNFLYEESNIFLERKYDKYKKLIAVREEKFS